ncbi:MAG: outer membrane beta-barrel protein [Terriglobia bacterium]
MPPHSKLLTGSFIACLLLFLPASSASAQEDSFRFEVFAQGGASFFSSASETRTLSLRPPVPAAVTFRTKRSFGTTGRLFTGFRYYLTQKNALEASYSYSPNRLQVSASSSLFPVPFFFSAPMRVHQGAFNYVRYFSRRGRIQPFATGGLGFVVFASVFDIDTKFAGNFGGGVDIRLHRRFYLRAEFRDFVSKRPRFSGRGRVTHNLAPSVGLVFKF